MEKEINAGFLIVKTFERMYREFFKPAEKDRIIYAVPRKDTFPDVYPKKYRGMDRDPLQFWDEDLRNTGVVEPISAELKAQLAIRELEKAEKSYEDFIFSIEDTKDVFKLIENTKEREVIWTRNIKFEVPAPKERNTLLGYEPTWFTGDHFSAISDCLCFPAWHGTDEEGKLFLPYFEILNSNALFNSPSDAENFLKFYLSQDWTERGNFVIAEVSLIQDIDF